MILMIISLLGILQVIQKARYTNLILDAFIYPICIFGQSFRLFALSLRSK